MRTLSQLEEQSVSGGEAMTVAIAALFAAAVLPLTPQLVISSVAGGLYGPYLFAEPVFNQTFSQAISNSVSNILNTPFNAFAGAIAAPAVFIIGQLN
ncbi:MAG: hypothetical protein U1E78_11165 [Gammaproteobacteria bacterium]